MRKIYSSLLVLMLMMVSTTVKAQYQAVINADPTDNWVAGQQSFAPGEIATALGLADAAALKELIATASKAEEPFVGAFYVKTADGKTNQYTGNENEFWLDDEGLPHEYGGASWFVGIEFEDATAEGNDSGEDRVNVYVGQMPKTFTKKYEASVLKTTVYLVNGEKEVSFEVTQNIAAAPEPTLSAPETDLTKLNIVKDYTVTIDFEEGGQYEGTAVTATLDGVYDALGVAQADLDPVVSDYILTRVVQSEKLNEGEDNETTVYSWTNTLALPADAAGGAWFGRYSNYDEATDKDVVLEYNAPKTWNTGANTYYLQDFALAEGELTIGSVGQFPGVLKAGDTDYTYLYLTVGDKAARIKVQVNVTEAQAPEPPAEEVPFDQCTEAGSTTIEVYNYAMGDYSTKAFTVGMDEVLEKLGCEASALTDFYAFSSEGVLATEHTTGEGGFYFNADGFVDTWSNKSPVYINYTDLPNGKFAIGQYGGYFLGKVSGYEDKAITEPYLYKTKFLYKYSDKYYTVNVNFTIYPEGWEIEDEDPGVNPDSQFDIVATLPITMQIIPADSYYGSMDEEGQAQMRLDLGIDKIKELIGDGTYTVYGLKAPATAKVYPELTGSTGYAPNTGFDGGFWMAMPSEKLGAEYVNTAFAGSWGTNSFGIEWILKDGVFGFDQIPSQRQVGDFFVATYYWVNTASNKAIKYELNVVYVDEIIPQAEIVGTIEEAVAIEEDKIDKTKSGEFFDVTIDKAKIAEALGIDEDLLSGVQAYYGKSQGVWATMTPGDDVQYFNANGYEDVEAGVEAAFSEEYVVTLTLDDVALGTDDKITLRYAFEYEGKRVLYTVVLGAPGSVAVGIAETPAAKAQNSAWYTLTGVKVAQPTAPGIYLKGGKKVYVK
ncbi:MAG: DUF4859 domain-containing protein [Bacteroidaceae bacterium]|nr:DUF4859 domain-containing protein [Bacteroidaceae bacterium]